MKKYFTIMVLFMLSFSMAAQQKFTVPVISNDQKYGNVIGQFCFAISGGISFAKTHGVTPYDYGTYVGKLAAPSWGEGNNFEAYVNSLIYIFEVFRQSSDSAMIVKENSDGSLSIISDENMWRKYFPDDNQIVSYQEFVEFMKGLNVPIADHMGANIKLEVANKKLICVLSKK